jgi:GntR family transcriptional regulator / MocR family aminotransferase
MRDSFFQLNRTGRINLQTEIRQVLVSAILSGHLPADERIPSSRKMAQNMGVSRNTVVLAYQGLLDDGYLVARERSGYYVNGKILEGRITPAPLKKKSETDNAPTIDWSKRFRVRPSEQENISKPKDWREFPYAFISGQVDPKLFPIAEWRDCSRQVLGKRWLDVSTADAHGSDDEMLIEQIRTHILPRRGILADREEILVTMGAQNALYLLASLLVTPKTTVGFEEPGYPDARNIFRLKTDRIEYLDVDEHGLSISPAFKNCDLIFTTPSYQAPTTVTMPPERRRELLEAADRFDCLIIEDDYEFEAKFTTRPSPALKSQDKNGRVIYVGSLSKTLFPGLRLGFLVGPRKFIHEARLLRRLMIRHPPNNNQRTTALFLSLGHHDALVHRLHRTYHARGAEMTRALSRFLPHTSIISGFGGSSFWLQGPQNLDADELVGRAQKKGILIESGTIWYGRQPAPKNYIRLGISSIEIDNISPGIELLAQIIDRLKS